MFNSFKKLRIPVIALICINSAPAAPSFAAEQARSAEALDKHMAPYLKKISMAAGNYDEMIGDVDDQLLDYLKKACGNPVLLTAPLPTCQSNGLKALASEDGQTRFFSWDTNTGGSMHYFYSLVQYRVQGKTYCAVLNPQEKNEENNDCGNDFDDVRSVKTKDGKTIYLATYSAYFSHPESCRSIAAYSIVGTKLVPVKVFQAKSQLLDTIDCPLHDTVEYQKNSFVKISKDGRIVSVPIITKNNVVTGHYLLYKFDGNKFVFDPKGK